MVDSSAVAARTKAFDSGSRLRDPSFELDGDGHTITYRQSCYSRIA